MFFELFYPIPVWFKMHFNNESELWTMAEVGSFRENLFEKESLLLQFPLVPQIEQELTNYAH